MDTIVNCPPNWFGPCDFVFATKRAKKMKPHIVFVIAAMLPLPVSAHPGHIIETAGHSHIAIFVALGAIAMIATWAMLKSRKSHLKSVVSG